MRTLTVSVLIAALMFVAIFEEALIFAVGRHLFRAAPTLATASPEEVKLALAASVPDAEAAERRACEALGAAGARTPCEAR